jgi:hypothetical protein
MCRAAWSARRWHHTAWRRLLRGCIPGWGGRNGTPGCPAPGCSSTQSSVVDRSPVHQLKEGGAGAARPCPSRHQRRSAGERDAAGCRSGSHERGDQPAAGGWPLAGGDANLCQPPCRQGAGTGSPGRLLCRRPAIRPSSPTCMPQWAPDPGNCATQQRPVRCPITQPVTGMSMLCRGPADCFAGREGGGPCHRDSRECAARAGAAAPRAQQPPPLSLTAGQHHQTPASCVAPNRARRTAA